MTVALQDGKAYIPGGRDRQGRPLLAAIATPRNSDGLGPALRGLATVFGPETKKTGLTILLDARRCSWRTARSAIRVVSTALAQDLGLLIVLRPEAFWKNQGVDCTKAHKDGEVNTYLGIIFRTSGILRPSYISKLRANPLITNLFTFRFNYSMIPDAEV